MGRRSLCAETGVEDSAGNRLQRGLLITGMAKVSQHRGFFRTVLMSSRRQSAS